MASWARVLALVFIVSFVISAVLSLLLLDELDASAHAARANAGPRASNTLLRHSLLPLSEKQKAYRARLQALHIVHDETLPSRRTPGTEAQPRRPARSSSGDSQSDSQSDAWLASQSIQDRAEHLAAQRASGALTQQELNDAMLHTAGFETDSAWAELLGEDAAHLRSGEDDSDDDHYDGDDGVHSDDASILFGGRYSSLEGVSLWSLMWRSVGVDLASWDVDISNITHTSTKPRSFEQKRGGEQQAPGQEQAPTQEPQSQEQVTASTPVDGQATTDGLTDAAPPTPTESGASPEASSAPSGASTPTPATVPPVTRPSPRATPSVSVLSDLLPQQGVHPYVSLSDNFNRASLVLVHAFHAASGPVAATQGRDTRGDGLVEWFTRDARHFIHPMQSVTGREAEAQAAAAAKAAAIAAADSGVPSADLDGLFSSPVFSALHIMTGFNLNDLLVGLEEDILSGLEELESAATGTTRQGRDGSSSSSGHGQQSGATGGGYHGAAPSGSSSTPRHEAVLHDDWTLLEYARVPGVIHASASTNVDGGGGEEEEWLAVAYERMATDTQQANEEGEGVAAAAASSSTSASDFSSSTATAALGGHVEIMVWFQPNSTSTIPVEQAHDTDGHTQSATAEGASATAALPASRDATVACEGASSRVCLRIRLPTLRQVTAMHIRSTRLGASDPHSSSSSSSGESVPLTVWYALRGDRYVFRTLEVRAVRAVTQGAEGADRETWTLSYEHTSVGPLASRHALLSQTVSLQPYISGAAPSSSPSSSGADRDADSSSPPPQSPAPAARVIASELNWLRGPLSLAGPLIGSQQNRWGSAPTNKPRAGSKQANYVQQEPPYSAAIYRMNDANGTGSEETTTGDSTQPLDATQAQWVRDQWISSSKASGTGRGGSVSPSSAAVSPPLSIHRGRSGSLWPLLTAASSCARFVAFAQLPLIVTIDANDNFEPVEIINLEQETVWTGVAIGAQGTILAVADNHQDLILLRRSSAAANALPIQAPTKANRTQPAVTPKPPTPTEASADAKTDADLQTGTGTGTAPTSEDLSSTGAAGSATGSSSPSSSAVPSAPAPAPVPPRRHAWEVMMEVVLPPHLRQLTLMSVQLVDVPVPAKVVEDIAAAHTHKQQQQKRNDARAAMRAAAADANAGTDANAPTSAPTESAITGVATPAGVGADATPSASLPSVTAPLLVLLFQGGVLATMQLQVLGADGVAAAAAAAAGDSSSGSAFPSAHFHPHAHASASLSLDTLGAFLHVHWDLLLIFGIGLLWLMLSLPRFNRIAQQAQQQQRQAQMQQQFRR